MQKILGVRRIIFFIIVVIITSCSKNKNDDRPLLDRIYKNGKLSAEFFYSKKNQLERYKSYYYNGVEEMNVEYDYDENDQVHKLEWAEGHYSKFVYENGLWIEEKTYIQQQSFPQLVSYTYREYNYAKIYEQSYIPYDHLEADIIRFIENGNEVKTVHFNTINGDTSSIIFREFDTFHNPFKNWLITEQISFNDNNILRMVTHTHHEDSVSVKEIVNSYTYDTDGYPVTMSIDGQGIKLTFEYVSD